MPNAAKQTFATFPRRISIVTSTVPFVPAPRALDKRAFPYARVNAHNAAQTTINFATAALLVFAATVTVPCGDSAFCANEWTMVTRNIAGICGTHGDSSDEKNKQKRKSNVFLHIFLRRIIDNSSFNYINCKQKIYIET